MELKNNFLICLTGLPASGKSIFAKKLKEGLSRIQNNFETIIIDTDKIRHSLYDKEFNHKKEILVREKNLKLIEKNLIEKKIVISDDLNYYSSMRHELREISSNLKLRMFIIYIATPFNICIEWNKKRGYTIPDNVIFNINRKFDSFQKYKWDQPDYTVDMSKELNLDKLISDIVLKMIKLDKEPNLQILGEEINTNEKKKKIFKKQKKMF
ncbi:MAG: adenylyl-sulfate kinase [Candidatus Lokiarchaeota archaeon]|nr:adenylyl-sulfate kinase [Candidatus Lokiarchaeota archaeon]